MLTENTIDVARIESQSLKINKQHVKLNDIITSVIADLKRTIMTNGEK